MTPAVCGGKGDHARLSYPSGKIPGRVTRLPDNVNSISGTWARTTTAPERRASCRDCAQRGWDPQATYVAEGAPKPKMLKQIH